MLHALHYYYCLSLCNFSHNEYLTNMLPLYLLLFFILFQLLQYLQILFLIGQPSSFLMTHSTRTYSCKICKENFSQTWHLKQHMLTHSDVQTFRCDVCQKRFFRKAHLKTHMLIHSGVRPFECYICKKRFAYKHVLRNHLATHLNDSQ